MANSNGRRYQGKVKIAEVLGHGGKERWTFWWIKGEGSVRSVDVMLPLRV